MMAQASAPLTWQSIDWQVVEAHVDQLQMRIAKAVLNQQYGKVKALQWILTHSLYAKLLAVKRVTSNQGSKTPGVDYVVWTTPEEKMQAIKSLKRRGYNAQPLRRVYIPKSDGKRRPLGIPTIIDRAQQALHLLSLEPIAESMADKNAYGFRQKRCCADAIEQCMRSLWQKGSAEWILEGDIEACFDNISHEWLLSNVPIDRKMLDEWLKSGYIHQNSYHPTIAGTPQGGIISPTLLVITLAGLEEAITTAISKRKDKVHLISYADDFVITGATQEVLVDKVKPIVQSFLAIRGLTLSERKTKISNINDGFDFLGLTIRKYKDKVLSKPSKTSIKRFFANLRHSVKTNKTAKTENLIRILNPKIFGWANYFRFSSAKQIFGSMEHRIFRLIWGWIHSRHPRKSAKWRKRQYFRSKGLDNSVFTTKLINKKGTVEYLDLVKITKIRIKRHIKIIADATPYDPKFTEYFKLRESSKRRGKGIISDSTSYSKMMELLGQNTGCRKA
jgi:RNA-directed DNA polymerase